MNKLRNLLKNHKFVASVFFLLILLVFLFWILNEPPRTVLIHSQNDSLINNSNFNETTKIWVKTTKTTGGLPFLQNDIYNTMGLELLTNKSCSGLYVSDWLKGSWVGAGQWQIFLAMTSIASSRLKDTDKNSSAIKSQTLTVIFPQVKTFKDLNYSVVGINDIRSDAFQSWPWKNALPSYGDKTSRFNWFTLNSEVISEMDNHTHYPLSPSEFSQSLGGIWVSHYGWSSKTPNVLVKIEFPYSQGYSNSYYSSPDSQGLNQGISDCGYTYYIDYTMSAGTTHEFDIITSTDWGLYETSEVSLHVKITAPPSPTGMSEPQLNNYGMKPLYNKHGDIIEYWINPNNISIEVT